MTSRNLSISGLLLAMAVIAVGLLAARWYALKTHTSLHTARRSYTSSDAPSESYVITVCNLDREESPLPELLVIQKVGDLSAETLRVQVREFGFAEVGDKAFPLTKGRSRVVAYSPKSGVHTLGLNAECFEGLIYVSGTRSSKKSHALVRGFWDACIAPLLAADQNRN